MATRKTERHRGAGPRSAHPGLQGDGDHATEENTPGASNAKPLPEFLLMHGL